MAVLMPMLFGAMPAVHELRTDLDSAAEVGPVWI